MEDKIKQYLESLSPDDKKELEKQAKKIYKKHLDHHMQYHIRGSVKHLDKLKNEATIDSIISLLVGDLEN